MVIITVVRSMIMVAAAAMVGSVSRVTEAYILTGSVSR